MCSVVDVPVALASSAFISFHPFFTRWRRAKMSVQQRKDRVKQKKAAFLKKMQEGDEEED